MRQRTALGDIGNDHLRAAGSDSQVLGKTFFIVVLISPQDAQKCESGRRETGFCYTSSAKASFAISSDRAIFTSGHFVPRSDKQLVVIQVHTSRPKHAIRTSTRPRALCTRVLLCIHRFAIIISPSHSNLLLQFLSTAHTCHDQNLASVGKSAILKASCEHVKNT